MWIRFSASAPGSADSTSDSTKDCEPLAVSLARSAWWRGKPSASRSWERRCKKGGWMNVLSGAEISETYPAKNFQRSTGSPAAIPASHLATLASEWEKTTLAICGPRSSTSCELFDPEESSSRTSPATCRSASIASFKTWRDAVTAVRSDCLRRRKSAHPTDASESSSLAWPTPRTMTGGAESAARKKELGRMTSGGGDLESAVRLWPTANARDWKGTYQTLMRKDGKMRGDLLPDAVKIEEDGVGSSSAPTATGTTKAGSSSVLAASITSNAEALDPRRTASSTGRPTGSFTVGGSSSGLDAPDNPSTKASRPAQLNPDWVEMLMGFPIGWTDCGLSGTR